MVIIILVTVLKELIIITISQIVIVTEELFNHQKERIETLIQVTTMRTMKTDALKEGITIMGILTLLFASQIPGEMEIAGRNSKRSSR